MKKVIIAAAVAAVSVVGVAHAKIATFNVPTGEMRVHFDDKACTIAFVNTYRGPIALTWTQIQADFRGDRGPRVNALLDGQEYIEQGDSLRLFYDDELDAFTTDRTSPGQRFNKCGDSVRIRAGWQRRVDENGNGVGNRRSFGRVLSTG